jgi:hypothetical protein
VVPFMPGEVVCALRVGAECDGPEDCASGSTCCARFSRTTYSYTEIACSSSCDAVDDYELCHPGQMCVFPRTCRRSLIVPHDFITVCAEPALVPTQTTSTALSGEIVCGDDRCAAGAEHCCLRNQFDFGTMMSTPLPPFCAPLGSECACDTEPPDVPPADLDAGHEDGG